MYIRFITPTWVPFARTQCGFFCAAFNCRDAPETPAWIADELARELTWFNDNLAVPETLFQRVGHRQWRGGVCWFRDRAAAHVSRARYICRLLGECGTPITALRGPHSRTVIWQDDHQIVALAPRQRH